MKSNKKVDMKTILVYCVMVLLIVIIVLPPVLRALNTGTSEVKVKKPQGTARALICKKSVSEGALQYELRVTSNYLETTLNKVTLSYQRNMAVDASVTNAIETEIAQLRQTPAVTETPSEMGSKFVMTKESLQKDPSNQLLLHYFQDFTSQQTNLQGLGYTCQEMTAEG